MDIGKVKKTTRKEPTFIPVKIVPKKAPKQVPEERPIRVDNWPTKKTADVPK